MKKEKGDRVADRKEYTPGGSNSLSNCSVKGKVKGLLVSRAL